MVGGAADFGEHCTHDDCGRLFGWLVVVKVVGILKGFFFVLLPRRQ